ncbi:MAG: pyridoxal-dependent decarboxylase [Microbacterium sp.]|uniref:pyridoxal phosphate-dependent decarboxylase family protein n=1 Tax=Microbacterium sp. TaxID=51671 RepID=UPI002728346D|nr:pyridoxal-dependent decarboxylase [Microbacterium sp.]MDO8384158.1 pyridoxal-dependent decarboxylase [Microbacterium sp.]
MSDFEYQAALDRAHAHSLEWIGSLGTRAITPRAGMAELESRLGALPDGPTDAAVVIDELARVIEPGLAAHGSGRFFGFVIGGAQPVAIAADWLVSSWDQNAGMLSPTPGVSATERIAGRWLLDLLGLPGDASVAFVTGATTANLTGIMVGRSALLRRAGWDEDRGLADGPRIRVLAGAEVHTSALQAVRYAGLPRPELVAVDDQGRMLPAALETALAAHPGQPTILLLQAGNIHSGASDPFDALIPAAHRHGAWVHVDGAFGLWGAASPALRHLTRGVELADSWATDAHKTLNVPHDSGVVIVRDRAAHRAAMSMHAPYLAHFDDGGGNPYEYVPEMSRRARGVPVWATLRALGRSGVADLVDRLTLRARQLAEGIAAIPGARILNDVVFTQVAIAFEDDERTRAVTDAILADGEVWMSGSEWHGRAVLRLSVSNWQTSERDVSCAIEAVRRATAVLGAARS